MANNSFKIILPGCNKNFTYRVKMYLSHLLFGDIVDYFIIEHRKPVTNESNVENKFVNIFGNNPFGWSSVIGFFVLIACMFSFSKRNIGVGLIITGGVMMFITAVVGVAVMDVTLSIIFIVCGIIAQWRISRMEAGS